jgi:hypothetical protein
MHLEGLDAVLKRLRKYDIQLFETKVELFEEEIDFLSHWINKNGIRPSPKKSNAIAEFPREEYTNQDRSACSNAYLDLIHWSRIWEYKVKLRKGMIPMPMVNQLRARVRKFRRQMLKDGPGSSSPVTGTAGGPQQKASNGASAPAK